MIEKVENPRINDSCSCGWKDCIFCDSEAHKKSQDKWNTCKYCGYDERTKTEKHKWVMMGCCNKCRTDRERKQEFEYSKKEGKATRDDEIMCPYCGYVDTTDIWECHNSKSFECPECEKESELSVEYTAHFTTYKKDEENDKRQTQ